MAVPAVTPEATAAVSSTAVVSSTAEAAVVSVMATAVMATVPSAAAEVAGPYETVHRERDTGYR